MCCLVTLGLLHAPLVSRIKGRAFLFVGHPWKELLSKQVAFGG